ncbi:MAG: RNA-protein complex protein Nop10 [Methanobacteriota archaeon]|nr:MAG: RNA-protein complex protein Nop10 [Euryarchaeota archaeon]
MRTQMRVCREDRTYTLRDACPRCGSPTVAPLPPRYSPEDRYGSYRRRLKREGAK